MKKSLKQHRTFSTSSNSANNNTNDKRDGFLAFWRDRINAGKLHPDKAQERVAKRLHRLQQAVSGYSNEAFFVRHDYHQNNVLKDGEILESKDDGEENVGKVKLDGHEQEKILPLNLPEIPRIPRGLYIHGPVGTGKSLLMDTFYETIDIPPTQKARYHFHAFMQDIHKRIHQLKQDDLKNKGRNFTIDTSEQHNPIVRVALQLSRETTLLCLDEFQVTDVADALIMSQLFEVLFTFGTIMVATSNRPPKDLYEGGLNRGYFLPFIGILERHCLVHSLASEMGDYRRVLSSMSTNQLLNGEENDGSAKSKGTITDNNPTEIASKLLTSTRTSFFLTEGNHVDATVKQLLSQVYPAKDHTNKLQSFAMPVGFGRTLTVSSGDSNGLVGVFSFEELCHGDLGAADYRAIAQQFSVIALKEVPQLTTYHHNRARRFITLVDELYEARCAFVCSINDTNITNPDDLFQATTDNLEVDLGEETSSVEVEKPLGIEDVQTQGGQPVSTLASVRELSFAFQRAASRITEMTSQRWWNQILQKDGWNKPAKEK